jgi:DNA-binding SARP family transcriptional activator
VAQASLFPESDRHKGSNHFRQVVHHLRKTATLTLQRLPSSTITWSDGISVDATDLQFERALAVARTFEGEERLGRLEAALDLVVGPYLVASDLEWACERRYELDVIQEVAELELACLAAHLKRFDLCRSHTQAVLARNPYSEAASRLLMESELALGSEARALAVYRQSVRARRDIGLPPDQALAGLLHSSA